MVADEVRLLGTALVGFIFGFSQSGILFDGSKKFPS